MRRAGESCRLRAALRGCAQLVLLAGGLLASAAGQAAAQEKAMDELRAMVFDLDPGEIGITSERLPHPVWGMVMETGFAIGSSTLVTLADGTTSIYFSSGGATVGAGEYPQVRAAVGHYLRGAQYFYERATRVDETPRPAAGQVIFYFLAFEGISAYTAPEDDLASGNDPLSTLFHAAHGVIDTVRALERQ